MAQRQIPPFGIRMPDDLKAWVKKTAQEEGRSANSLIVRILQAKMAAARVAVGTCSAASKGREISQ